MIWRIFPIAALFVTVAVADSQTTRNAWTFDADAPGKVAEGFTVETGRWEVARDGGNGVLVQVAKSEDAAFNIAILGATNERDIDLSVRLRAISGEVDQGGGLIWRARDVRNYYLARFNPLEDNYRFYKVVDGKRTQLKSAKIPSKPGWHTLRVTMVGPRVACYLDGQRHLEADD